MAYKTHPFLIWLTSYLKSYMNGQPSFSNIQGKDKQVENAEIKDMTESDLIVFDDSNNNDQFLQIHLMLTASWSFHDTCN